MCETCDDTREKIWAEIRDLTNFKRKACGPLSQKLKDWVEEEKEKDAEFAALGDDEINARLEIMRAEMIAGRCALLASAATGQPTHHVAPSTILGVWAGNIMQTEMEINPLGTLFRLLGGGL